MTGARHSLQGARASLHFTLGAQEKASNVLQKASLGPQVSGPPNGSATADAETRTTARGNGDKLPTAAQGGRRRLIDNGVGRRL